MQDFNFGLNQFIMAHYSKEYQTLQDSTKAKAKVIGILMEEVDKLVNSEKDKSQSKLRSLTYKPAIEKLLKLREEALLMGHTNTAKDIEWLVVKLRE